MDIVLLSWEINVHVLALNRCRAFSSFQFLSKNAKAFFFLNLCWFISSYILREGKIVKSQNHATIVVLLHSSFVHAIMMPTVTASVMEFAPEFGSPCRKKKKSDFNLQWSFYLNYWEIYSERSLSVHQRKQNASSWRHLKVTVLRHRESLVLGVSVDCLQMKGSLGNADGSLLVMKQINTFSLSCYTLLHYYFWLIENGCNGIYNTIGDNVRCTVQQLYWNATNGLLFSKCDRLLFAHRIQKVFTKMLHIFNLVDKFSCKILLVKMRRSFAVLTF